MVLVGGFHGPIGLHTYPLPSPSCLFPRIVLPYCGDRGRSLSSRRNRMVITPRVIGIHQASLPITTTCTVESVSYLQDHVIPPYTYQQNWIIQARPRRSTSDVSSREQRGMDGHHASPPPFSMRGLCSSSFSPLPYCVYHTITTMSMDTLAYSLILFDKDTSIYSMDMALDVVSTRAEKQRGRKRGCEVMCVSFIFPSKIQPGPAPFFFPI